MPLEKWYSSLGAWLLEAWKPWELGAWEPGYWRSGSPGSLATRGLGATGSETSWIGQDDGKWIGWRIGSGKLTRSTLGEVGGFHGMPGIVLEEIPL